MTTHDPAPRGPAYRGILRRLNAGIKAGRQEAAAARAEQEKISRQYDEQHPSDLGKKIGRTIERAAPVTRICRMNTAIIYINKNKGDCMENRQRTVERRKHVGVLLDSDFLETIDTAMASGRYDSASDFLRECITEHSRACGFDSRQKTNPTKEIPCQKA